MSALLGLTNGLGAVNAALLTLSRRLGAACVALMVVVILLQVFFRYVLGNALPWPEEASRFLMLWMAGLMSPTAFRRGGFVSILMLVRILPRAPATMLSLVLLLLSLLVLVVGFRIGWAETTGLGGRFATDSLSVPTRWDFSTWAKVPKSWMMGPMVLGLGLMISVCVELMLRSVMSLLGSEGDLNVIPESAVMGSE